MLKSKANVHLTNQPICGVRRCVLYLVREIDLGVILDGPELRMKAVVYHG